MRKFGYVQQVVDDFYQSRGDIVTVSILPGTYASINSARCAYRNAIKKLGYNNLIAVRVINGDIYLIRVKDPCWTAKTMGVYAITACTDTQVESVLLVAS